MEPDSSSKSSGVNVGEGNNNNAFVTGSHQQQPFGFPDLKMFLVMLYAFIIYFMGYYGFSFWWIIMVVPLWIYHLKRQKDSQLRVSFARELAKDEKKTLKTLLPELPSWVFFADTEKASWLNEIIKRLWPYISDYVRDYAMKLEPQIREKITKLTKLDTFKIIEVHMGDTPLKVYGIKVYPQTYSRREIVMDLDLAYSGDCGFQVSLSKVKAGIKDVKFRGTMRVIMKPLVKHIPLIGGLQVFFLQAPVIDFNLTEIANLLDFPGIKDYLLKAIVDVIGGMMVLPNKYPIKLISSLPERVLRYPEPKGVLRVHVIEAEKLMKKDISLLSGKSDPYAVISVGAQEFRTATINNNINPQWNFVCEALVDDILGQSVDLEVRDEDVNNKDDFLGSLTVNIKTIAKQGSFDKWISLEDAETGIVHLQLHWYSLCPDLLKLQQYSGVPMQNKNLSTAVLIVYVESAENLPNAELKSVEEPSPYAVITVDNVKHTTHTCKETNHPEWNKGFSILISDPEHQKLSIEVMDQKTNKVLGRLQYAIEQLKYETNLETHRPFVLKGSGPHSHITLGLQLKIMTQEKPDKNGASGSQPATPASVSPPNGIPDVAHQPRHSPEPPAVNETVVAATEPIARPVGLENEMQDQTLRKRHQEPSEQGKFAIQMTLRYSLPRQTLIIVVHKVQNVPKYNSSDLPDPYVKLLLLTGSTKDNKRKTSSVKNNCNPIFDETIEYQIVPSDLTNRNLQILVCSRSTSGIFGRSVTIGKKTISLSELDLSNSVTKWFDLEISTNEDNGGND